MSDLTVLPDHVRAPPRAGRHRREPAPPLLGDPHRPGRLAAGRVRGRDRDRGRRGVVVRPRRLRGVGARAVGGAGARQPRAPDRPGARLGRGRQPSRRPGARTSSSRPGLLEPADWSAELVQPRAAGRARGARPPAAARVRARQARRPRPALRHRAGRLRGRAQRRRRRRPRAGARLDRLRAPAALPDLRRHRSRSPRVRTPSASRSPTAGTAATSASPARRRSTATGSARSCSSRSSTPTAAARR